MSDESESAHTVAHILRVRELLEKVCDILTERGWKHDSSKLESPEVEMFDRYAPELRGLTYGSPEYFETLKLLGPALKHHYAFNSHHPEFYGHLECSKCSTTWLVSTKVWHCPACGEQADKVIPNMKGMDLFDLIEMFVDWKAATERHADGDLEKSIKFNQLQRFMFSDDLREIFLNTVPFFEDSK